MKTPHERMQDFWISFDAGLYSGLISSLIGGVIVGFALWWLQVLKENREVSRNCERELLSFVDRISRCLSRDDVFRISESPERVIPEVYEDSAKMIEDIEISYWKQNIKRTDLQKLLKLFERVIKSYINFKRICYSLNVFVENEFHRRRLVAGNAQLGSKYLYLTALEIDFGDRVHVYSDKNTLDDILTTNKDIFHDYKMSVDELINDITVLKGKLHTIK